MPKFIGTITRDETSDFKLVVGQDVNIRGSNDSTYIPLADDDLLLLDDVSLSPGNINGTESSTGKIQMSQVKSYIGLADIAVASSSLQLITEDTSLSNTSAFYYAIESSLIEPENILTIDSTVDFSVIAADPSADEEVRIDHRLRFDAEMAYSLANIHTKVDWLEQEVGERTRGYFNRLVNDLGGGDSGSENSKLIGYTQMDEKISEINDVFSQVVFKTKIITEINNILTPLYSKMQQMRSAIIANNDTIAAWTQSLKSSMAAILGEENENLPSVLSAGDFSGVGNIGTATLNDDDLSVPSYAYTLLDFGSGIPLLTNLQAASYSIPRERSTIGGTWSFDYTSHASGQEDVWISTEAHGLETDDKIMFISSASTPQQFSPYKIYSVVEITTTVIQLKVAAGTGSVIAGTADSSDDWTMVYALDPDSTLGGLPYSVEYDNAGAGHNMKPDLVTDETYTTGGVCSLSQYHTSDACARGGGTWYPTETI